MGVFDINFARDAVNSRRSELRIRKNQLKVLPHDGDVV